ncbi:MAG: PorT family protein [Chlorobi bacterium]|nr:PorT family protein [Chlorobiota bacterium]
MRKFTVGILLIAFYFNSFSQDKEWQNRNYVGFHIGKSVSKINLIYNDPSIFLNLEDPYLSSVNFGLSFKNFSEKLGILNIGISADVNYLKNGGYLNFNLNTDLESTGNVLVKYVPTYIELNPLVDLSFGRRRLHISLLGGPHFSFLIDEEINLITQTNGTYKTKADNSFLFGMDLGAGVDFELKKSSLEIRFMYGLGFTDIFTPEEIDTNLWNNQNRTTSLMLFYYYKL